MPTMPTTEQLKAYADRLPVVYRDILNALHAAAAPYRHFGEGMALDVLQTQLHEVGAESQLSVVYPALEQLEKSGFVELDVQDLTYVTPTPLGEELIAVMTGKTAPRVEVPDLPKPTW